jgi:hypothetical protein
MVDENYFPSDTWNTFDYLTGVSRREFNGLYAAARRQQAIMALTSGDFEWRNYRGIAHKAYSMLFGKHRAKPERVASFEDDVQHTVMDKRAVEAVESA